jgi:predicted phage terminase large subunit-like protein
MPVRTRPTPPNTPEIQLSSTQLAFVTDTHTYSAFVGGIGSGKSYAGAVKVLAQHSGSGLGLVISPTYPMLRDATWRTCLEVWHPWIANIYRQDMRVTLRSGMEALFRSADDPERLRGPNASWAWIDEAAQCHPDTWPVIIGRLREGGNLGRAWMTTTPKGMNWVYDVFVTGKNDDTGLYRATTAANPFLDERFVRTLRSQYASEYARQELGGEFITLGAGLIRRSWLGIADRAPAGLRWVRYWDLATSTKTTADYTAGAKAAVDTDGRVWLADIVRGRWEWPEARRVILQTMKLDGCEVGVEQVAFQAAAVQELRRAPEALSVAVRGFGVDRDKLARAQPWIAKAEGGLMTLVRGPWIPDFLSEAENFPEGVHDDMVDAVSGAVAMLARPTGWGAH